MTQEGKNNVQFNTSSYHHAYSPSDRGASSSEQSVVAPTALQKRRRHLRRRVHRRPTQGPRNVHQQVSSASIHLLSHYTCKDVAKSVISTLHSVHCAHPHWIASLDENYGTLDNKRSWTLSVLELLPFCQINYRPAVVTWDCLDFAFATRPWGFVLSRLDAVVFQSGRPSSRTERKVSAHVPARTRHRQELRSRQSPDDVMTSASSLQLVSDGSRHVEDSINIPTITFVPLFITSVTLLTGWLLGHVPSTFRPYFAPVQWHVTRLLLEICDSVFVTVIVVS